MGWSEFDTIICKQHPEHRQRPGVCSLCLREKLSHLSNSSPPHPSQIIRTIVAVSTLSADSSHSSSTSFTPPLHSNDHRRRPHHHHRRHASTGGSLGFIISSNAGGGLKKSRSIAFIEEEGGKKKESGFWKKLIRSTGKGTKKVFMHSRTVKEERSHAF